MTVGRNVRRVSKEKKKGTGFKFIPLEACALNILDFYFSSLFLSTVILLLFCGCFGGEVVVGYVVEGFVEVGTEFAHQGFL
jgi:hypothetical protein